MNPSELIDKRIAELPDWRGEMMTQIRNLIHEVDPEIVEEWKWNTPIWSRNGMVCALGSFKKHLKLNFFQGPALSDPDHLFNASLDAKTMRSIDFHEGDEIDEAALKRLIQTAIAYNVNKG